MNVVIVGGFLPYPANSGSRIRMLNLAVRLAKRHRITYVATRNPDRAEGRQALDHLGDHGIEAVEVEHTPLPKRGPRFYAKLAANLVSPVPYSVASFDSPALRARRGRDRLAAPRRPLAGRLALRHGRVLRDRRRRHDRHDAKRRDAGLGALRLDRDEPVETGLYRRPGAASSRVTRAGCSPRPDGSSPSARRMPPWFGSASACRPTASTSSTTASIARSSNPSPPPPTTTPGASSSWAASTAPEPRRARPAPRPHLPGRARGRSPTRRSRSSAATRPRRSSGGWPRPPARRCAPTSPTSARISRGPASWPCRCGSEAVRA